MKLLRLLSKQTWLREENTREEEGTGEREAESMVGRKGERKKGRKKTPVPLRSTRIEEEAWGKSYQRREAGRKIERKEGRMREGNGGCGAT